MSRRPVPWFFPLCGLGVVLVAVLGPVLARAQPPDATAADPIRRPRVRVQPVVGSVLEGTLRLPAVVVKTESGTATVEVAHIRRITFQRDPEGTSHDVVQLADKSLVRGQVLQDEFVLDGDGGGEVIVRRAELREIRFVREEHPGLGVVLFGLLALTAMEIVLGVDNVIFIAIVAGKLPEAQRPRARRIGLVAALGTRLLLLFSLSFLLGLTTPVFTLPNLGILRDLEAREVSWRDIILLAGGFFLIGKSTYEMHEKLEEARKNRQGEANPAVPAAVSFARTVVTIVIIDIVFSLDSVITAVGMVESLWVMVVAMVLSMLVMLYFAGAIAEFVDRHPTVKVLALSFLILIGVMLVAEGLGQHIDKGYIYTAMAFSVLVELVNLRLRKPASRG